MFQIIACEYNGVHYQNHESFNKGDGCNQCACKEGTVECTAYACSKYCIV